MFRWLTKAVSTLASGLTFGSPALSRWASGIGGRSSPSGKIVTVDTALQLAAVWACVQLISQTIATLPFMVFAQDGEGNRTVAADHPLYTLLHDQPNADMTSVEFWEAMIACVLLWGNAYARMDKNAVGDVISLTPMPPDRMNVRRLDDGSLLYTFSPFAGPLEEFTEDQLFHIKGWSLTGMLGLSPIGYASASLGTAQAADEAAGKFFANGLNASGFIETGGNAVLKPEQRDRFKAELSNFTGSSNSSKVMLLEGGFKYSALSLSPNDAQLLATREFSVDEICRWFRVPAWMIGHMTKTTSWGTGLEQQNIGFLIYTLRPWLSRVEQRVKMSLIKPADRGRVLAEFNVDGLLRGDSAARAALYASASQNGWQTRREIRRRENLSAYTGEGDDKLTVQSNLIPLDALGKQPADQTAAGFGLSSSTQSASPPEGQ